MSCLYHHCLTALLLQLSHYISIQALLSIYHFLNKHGGSVGVRYPPHGAWFVQLSIAFQSTHYQYMQRWYCCTADGELMTCHGVSMRWSGGRLISGSWILDVFFSLKVRGSTYTRIALHAEIYGTCDSYFIVAK